MERPEIPQNEKERLEKLKSLNILDTVPEERFDRLTRLAKKIFNTPIALVSLVDDDRQWFKSCLGLEASQTPRDISFCGHAILGDDIFLVNNALEDERFKDNPLVTGEPHIRFYAGVPLFYSDNIKLGTLCIIDQEPRDFSSDDLELLKDLAILAQQELVSAQLAVTDDLTGLTNRRGFNLLAQKVLNVIYRENIPSVLLFFDLNEFKSINDDFGHDEGDYVLKVFSNCMKESFRDSDIFARLGGDEFIVLLSDSTLENAKLTVRRLENCINESQLADKNYEISFSVGLLSIDLENRLPLNTLIKDADTLMYKNKNNSKIKF